MNRLVLPLLLFVLLPFGTFAAAQEQCALSTDVQFLALAKKRSVQSQMATDLRQKGIFAEQGVAFAESCLKKSPDKVGCYYYRAVNRGLDLETRALGIKKDLKRMIADFRKVIELDDRYDAGGAYQALGYVYLKSPSLPVLGKGIQRDLSKAKEYAGKALAIGPFDPLNLKFAGEVAYKKKNYKAAAGYFKKSLRYLKYYKSELPQRKSLQTWLKKWIKKAKKKAFKKS